ncbi:MAG TPA: hypothetical protein VLZ83_15270 [Edaphocola sp.]|nr:hypothetical protein [Edaphocola sp.]
MELIELQAIWQQHDKNLLETTKINKEVLKRILISKPEKRISWEKIKAGFNLILPIASILLILIPNIQFRSSVDFYVGALMFTIIISTIYYWSIRYFILIRKVNFSNTITTIKKQVKQIEKYKIKLNKLGYILMPFGIIGIFLMGNFPLFSESSILPISLIIIVMVVSIFYTFKYSISEQFKKLNMEIEEIENLEKG